MAIYNFDELVDAPIIKNCVYKYGVSDNGSVKNPLTELLGVGNNGGIRPKRTRDGTDYAYFVLVSNNHTWGDEYDPTTGLFRYHGDNSDNSEKAENKRGNKSLLKMLNGRIAPLLIFKTTWGEEGGSRDAFRFIGVAKPIRRSDGTLDYSKEIFGSGPDSFENYVYNLKVLDTGEADIRPWLTALFEKSPNADDLSPEDWKNQLSECCVPMSKSENEDFFKYLESKGLIYPLKTVENFLLSLKAKQFVILSGGSGSGKTSLAKAYAEYIKTDNVWKRTLTLETTLFKKSDSEVNLLTNSVRNPEDFFSIYPIDFVSKLKLPLKIGNIDTSCTFLISPRVVIDRKDKEKVKDEIDRIKNDPTIIKPEYNGKKYLELNIGIGSDNDYRLVPVGSNWTENRHILGYYNLINNEYKRTPAYEIMLRAQEDPCRTCVIILDEMNLSHVERYFSDILSAMESRVPIDTEDKDNPKLYIRNNLIIIGTVNQDETTYSFSPKVLDRANVIEFQSSDVREMLTGSPHLYSPEGDVDFLVSPLNRDMITSKKVKDILDEISKEDSSGKEILTEIEGVLNSLQEALKKIGFAFGFRTVEEVMRFMYAAWIYERKNLSGKVSRYLDAQIMQKILPKVHGNNSILPVLEELADICESRQFHDSKAKLDTMISVLKNQRYVSFNC